jgi:ankyrin repeat protein
LVQKRQELIKSVESDDIKQAKALLSGRHAKDYLVAQNDFKQTPLLLAMLEGKVAMVKLLLRAYATTNTDINQKDAEGNTALHLALQQPFSLKGILPLLKFRDLIVHIDNNRLISPSF